MFSTVPKQRLFIYFIVLGLLPIFISILFSFSAIQHVQELRSSVQDLQQMASSREKKQASNLTVRNHYREADHFYIDKHLETLTFLEPEIEGLQKILNNKNFADDDALKKRLEMLTGPANSMAFSEGVVESSPIFQETTETLVHPVEINSADLQKILARIEGVEIGPYSPSPNRPQLIILDFKLDKKSITEKNEVFTLNLKLLKREFL